MTLRLATPADVDELVVVGRASFTDAFGDLYAPADLEAFLGKSRSPAQIAKTIADPSVRMTVIEDEAGAIVAYCTTVFGKGFKERPAPKPGRPATLAQLYCVREATGRGHGARLLEDAVSEARRRGCDAIQLSVYSGNTAAQRFYARHGFVHVGDIDFWVGDHRDDEYLYELRLTGDAA